jgi:hypothetical protein
MLVRTRSLLLLCLLLMAFPLGEALAGSAGNVSSVSLTVYNDNLALIKEVRPLSLDSGVQDVVLTDVSGQLLPQTVHLKLPGSHSVDLLEQNYDYDLVSSDKLLQRFIGKQIILVNDEKGTELRGTLLSVNGGMVLDVDGQVMLNPPGRVILPQGAADELLLKPTLSWKLASPDSLNADAEISYLSTGLSWTADYVLVLAQDDKSAGMEGWVTMSNYSGTTYQDARLKLVAGEVNRAPEEKDMYRMAEAAPMAADGAGAGFEEESFYEYHLYDLQRPTTIRNNQQKQIGLLTAAGIPTKKLMLFNGQSGGDVRVMVEFTNDEESQLGMPLPAGTVRVYKADSHSDLQFVGEDRIEHTPKDETVRLYTGNAFDIVGETTQTEYKDLGKGYQESYKVVLKNHKESEDVVVTVQMQVWGDWEMISSNYDYRMKDAFTAEFDVPVKADSEVELNYAYRVTWK